MLALAPPSNEVIAAEIATYTDEEKQWLAQTQHFQEHEVGYQRIQMTKVSAGSETNKSETFKTLDRVSDSRPSYQPQTLGFGLSDSPLGLLAWIAEKFHGWTDLRGEKDFPPTISKDKILTNVMVYYVTNSIVSSCRLYYEAIYKGDPKLLAYPTSETVAVGVAAFPRELYLVPRAWCQRSFPNLVQFERFDTGGHFAALEEGAVLLGEITRFVESEGVKKALAA